jgi:ABC-type transport system involved in multi-copper enzyme maturation permease subunit
MREWNAFWMPFLYVATLSLAFGAAYSAAIALDVAPWKIGQNGFVLVSISSLTLLGLAVPVFAAGSITGEREQRTLGPLLLTRLAPRDIVTGKVVAAVAYGLLLLSLTLPVVAACFALGGVAPAALVIHYLSLGGAAVALGAFGVFVSAWFKRSVYSIAVCYGALAVILGVALFVAALLAGIEHAMQIPILRRMAFLSPLFFLNENTRGQWPLSLAWLITVALLLREAAVARLAREDSSN